MKHDVRFWPIADIPSCTAHVRFGGKADIDVSVQAALIIDKNP